MISFDRIEYPGGTELRILISPMARELIRTGVMVAGLLLIFFIIYLI